MRKLKIDRRIQYLTAKKLEFLWKPLLYMHRIEWGISVANRRGD